MNIRTLASLFVSAFTAAIPSSAIALDVGSAAPAALVKNQLGEEVVFPDEISKGYALVFFYPKADTPGCTKQACSLRDAYEELTEKGVKIFGVSVDTVEDQKSFSEKFKLPYPLLADTEKSVIKAFGVSLRGNFSSRQAYLFKDGKLIWKDESASTEDQAKDVLAVLKG